MAALLSLADVCEAIVDCPHATAPTQAAGIPQIRTTDVSNGRLNLHSAKRVSEDTYRRWTERIEPREGDIILAREAPVGEVGMVPRGQRVCQGQRTVLLRADSTRAHPRFLLYLLLTPRLRQSMVSLAEGSTNPHLNVADLRRLRIPNLPRLETQVRVGGFLGALDDKIELNRRMNRTLEETARAIFKSWFVDFDPVRGNATVPDHIRGLFPDRLVDSPAGPIPEGWKVTRLGRQVDVTRGLSYSGDGLADEGMPLHNLNSVLEGGGHKCDGIKYYTGAYRERDLVRPGDVIVANTEQGFEHLLIGYPAIVPRLFGDEGLYSQDLSRVRPAADSPFTSRYTYLLLAGFRMHHTVAGYSNGTTVNHLSPDGLRKPLVIVPPAEVIARFDDIVCPMFDQQEALVAECQILADLRDTLLPELISGEVRLNNLPTARSDVDDG